MICAGTKKELRNLKEILIDKMPLACEEKVIHRYLDFFRNDPGLFLHGFGISFMEHNKTMRFVDNAIELRNTE